MNDMQKFAYFQKSGKMPQERPKSTHGVLYLNGNPITHALPYALLQGIRKQYIQNGVKKESLKIKKHIQ